MKKIRILLLNLTLITAASFLHAEIIKLEHPLLKAADSIGMFDHSTILDILRTRKGINELVIGKKAISGVTIHSQKLHTFLPRAELLGGATYVIITAEHPELASFITPDQTTKVQKYLSALQNQTLYNRLISLSFDTIFTGSYLLNPITQEPMPVYISDYTLDTIETRTYHMHLGIPAHNARDFEFAKLNNLSMKVVVTIQIPAGRKDIEAPEYNVQGNLKAPFLREFKECIMINSAFLTDMLLHEARKKTIEFLEQHNAGFETEELIQYVYDGEKHSMRSLAHIEEYLNEHRDSIGEIVYTKKMAELKILLKYGQADFLLLVEPFFLNVRNTKDLMSKLVAESCEKTWIR